MFTDAGYACLKANSAGDEISFFDYSGWTNKSLLGVYGLKLEGGGGTTVVANPQGTPTGELNTIQIGDDIYEITGGSGGSGFSKTTLYEISGTTPESVITLSQSIENFDLIEVVSLYGHSDEEDYKNTTMFNAEELIDSIGATRPKNWWVGNDTVYVWFYVTDVDEFTIHTQTGQTGLGIWYVYGYKFEGGGGSVIGKKDILWEYSDSYNITLAHPLTDYDFLVFEGNNYSDVNHKGGAIISSAELDSIIGVSGKLYTFNGAMSVFANYTVGSTTSLTYVEGEARVLRVLGIKFTSGGGGGHTILDDSGTSLAQEDDLQFKGTYSHDDSTNGKTVVEVVRSMTKAEFDQLTSAEKTGIINVTDESGLPWKDITGVLSAGETEITLGDIAINSNSTFDIYTNPIEVSHDSVEFVAGTETALQPLVTQESELLGTVTVSSTFSSYAPWKAFTSAGSWVAEGNIDHWLAYEFPTNVIVSKVQWFCEDTSRRGTVTNIQYSNDGTTWNNCTLSKNERGDVEISSVNNAKHWRLFFAAPFGTWTEPMIGGLEFIAVVNGVKLTFPVQPENLNVKVRIS